jgi:hypothetical protein
VRHGSRLGKASRAFAENVSNTGADFQIQDLTILGWASMTGFVESRSLRAIVGG